MLQVYTGNGKGKTTAAIGLALRALGQGRRVFLVQFMKEGKDLGEIKALRRFRKIKILQAGSGERICRESVSLKDKQLAQKGLAASQEAIESDKYDLVILDEANVALNFGLFKLGELKKILKNRPQRLEIVLTGRDAHPEILEIADLVSDIKELKHYYKSGIVARAGIEY
ncbi:MAG: cob(I)yrinic acid a,c-diamide adenosyltransferase [Candidatus Omnitrophota bacterium]|nr:MAG: cob(I)yrinic acid a,c-diamide adenosyltransferase [Candidatus Omnitrophota bacterium]